ncbi:hypothetical protein [Phaeovulum sp. NW3]|uniref:hypothetical protein n=1 Tax=Phaeovulum sp. NW3 TaxID=2934933 RepID=UPI0032E43175
MRTLSEALQQVAWWDWPHDVLRAALPDIRALPIDAFIEKYSAPGAVTKLSPNGTKTVTQPA